MGQGAVQELQELVAGEFALACHGAEQIARDILGFASKTGFRFDGSLPAVLAMIDEVIVVCFQAGGNGAGQEAGGTAALGAV